MKKILNILLSILLTISLAGCSISSIDDDLLSNSYEITTDSNMVVEYDSYFGYSIEIKGTLKNTSNIEFTYVSVTFAIFDEEGNQIATALDNMNYLQPGRSWAYTAIVIGWTEVEPKSYTLVDVTIF